MGRTALGQLTDLDPAIRLAVEALISANGAHEKAPADVAPARANAGGQANDRRAL